MGLRVALVLDGEVGRDVVAFARALGTLNVDVSIVAPPTSVRGLHETGANVVPLSVGVSAVASLRRVVRDVDVIHAYGLRAGLAASVARIGGTPLVVDWSNPAHVSGMSGLAGRALGRTVALAADLTIAGSTELLEAAARLGARDVRLAPVVGPELPAPARDPDEVREELGITGPMVLACGRLHASNHHDLVISAAARWRYRRPVPQVVLCGTGPAYRDLVGQAAMSRAPVVFAGHRDDVPDLLRAADLAVVTAERVRPAFALEAAQAGVALVATAGPDSGLVDLLDGSAALVPREDVDAFDDAVRRLLDDSAARAVLAAAGRVQAASWPSVTEAAERVVAWYADLSAETGRFGAEADRDAPGADR